jgi:hypothetical protein
MHKIYRIRADSICELTKGYNITEAVIYLPYTSVLLREHVLKGTCPLTLSFLLYYLVDNPSLRYPLVPIIYED